MIDINHNNDLELINEHRNSYLSNKRIFFIPLIIVELFFCFTIILYLFGPTMFEKTNTIFLLILLISYHTAFSLGYLYEINKKSYINAANKKRNMNSAVLNNRITKFVKLMIIAGLFITTISTITYANISSLSPSVIFQQIIHSINNPLLAYSESFRSSGGGAIYKFLVLSAPISWAAFPLSVAFFKRLPITYKLLTVIMFFSEALRWIVMGRNKGVFDLAIIISAIIFMKILQSKYEYKNKRISGLYKVKPKKMKSKRAFVSVTLILIAIVSYFTNAIGSRTQYYSYNSSIYEVPIMRLSPEFLHPTIIYLTSYLTQGYHAFSKLIDVEWSPMFGIGNSMFLISNFSGLFEHDFFQYTYQTKLVPKGIDSMVAWHSFYTWIANDVHWLGVIVVMFLVGKYFAFVVKRNIIYGEIITYPIICLLFIMMFYLSGNNQIFSQPNTFVTFWFLFAYWLLIRKNIVFTRSVYGLFDKDIYQNSVSKEYM